MMQSQIPPTTIPTQIEMKLKRINELNISLTAFREELEFNEAKFYLEVCAEKADGTDKLKYTNDRAREAATLEKMMMDTSVADFKASITETEKEKSDLQAEIEALKMQFKIYIADREFETAAAGTRG